MSYLQRNRRTPYSKYLAILAGVFVAGWAFFSLAGGFVVSAVVPVWRSEFFATRLVRQVVEGIKFHSALVSENLALRDKVSSLELELAAADLSLAEERSLASLLGREKKEDEIVASVLSRPPQSPYDLFVIDIGEKNGVKVGARVSLPEGPVVGTVTDIFPSSSKVRLFSTAGEKIEAILERGNTPVVLEGRGGGSFRIVVPRETVAVVGDRVLSAESGSSLVAVVEGVEADPTDSFKEILARSPANIFSVRLVSVAP